MIRIAIFGTPEFTVRIAEGLYKNKLLFEIVGCVTTPDAPVGRKKTLTPSKVSEWSRKNNISVLKPESLKDKEFQRQLLSWQADIWLVVAYGKILPASFLDLVPNKVLNVHPSILPLYRGSSPLQATLRNGDSVSGISLMLMDPEMDHGPIVSQIKTNVSPDEMFEDYSKRLALLSLKLIEESLPDFINGNLIPQDQNHEKATYVSMIKKQDGLVDWEQSAYSIYNAYRAYHIWPGIYTFLNARKIEFKIIGYQESTQIDKKHWLCRENEIVIGVDSGQLLVDKIKPAGKNWLDSNQWKQFSGLTGIFD